ncbi:MAG: leucyl aminopeptidase [Bacteroidetes bacterium]|jgi:leucyl aminopeptidase|nr:leucyl aminopeptidase [Bacteroidota bacterium]MBT6686146.1 leucyl aminopeptidase [Bacteroidota bacterium]MBT7143857.1 leucyl aminopeptidase [Bacteroidota bacterium]MBT7491212.1 leucyl aminopeptidase [Bacteroidota bacterium]
MNLEISKGTKNISSNNLIVLTKKDSDFKQFCFSDKEIIFANKNIEKDITQITITQDDRYIFLVLIDEDTFTFQNKEKVRKAAYKLHKEIIGLKINDVCIQTNLDNSEIILLLAEGLALSNYQFLKYFTDELDKKKNSLEKIKIVDSKITDMQISEMNSIIKAVFKTKDLINEPVSYLNSVQLANEFEKMSNEAGFSIDIFDEKKIKQLKMGGLLAVNQGSIDPPRFSIMEWKPENAKNKKPVIIVGKGLVYDTGGLSLKPTKGMDSMKSDMSGGAAVAGLFYAVAKQKLPVHIIGLVPSTDNRPDGNAYAPGDVVKMHNGLNVEVLNTDAEGRMILADALSFSEKYEPELVIDIATLTGSAAIATGKEATVVMGNADDKTFDILEKSGNEVFERVSRFPFWDEYNEMLKSDIADLQNIGGREAGAITAGKFLEHFTKSPFIHIDIAGTAFLSGTDSYKGKGATGVGVRLLYEFLKQSIVK